VSIHFIAPASPYVIRFEDNRCISGYSDIEYLSEEEARKGWANLKRKDPKSNAELWVESMLMATHYRK